MIIVIVRPISILIATTGRELDFKEKLFLAWLAPRGIVTAAVASFFYQIRAGWHPWFWTSSRLGFSYYINDSRNTRTFGQTSGKYA